MSFKVHIGRLWDGSSWTSIGSGAPGRVIAGIQVRRSGTWDEQRDVGDGGMWSGLREAEFPWPAGWWGSEGRGRRRGPGSSHGAELMELFRHLVMDAVKAFREVSN